MTDLVRSISEDQSEILRSILALHAPDGFDVDMTYGAGNFYKEIPEPSKAFDIDPQKPNVTKACSRMLPLDTASVSSVIFDPPFLTYVRDGRLGNGQMAMARRYSGYWRYDELEDHYIDSISEAWRVLKDKGVFVVKCQDIVHNHRLHCTHHNVINWASIEGFRLKDLFVLCANRRMPSPNRRGTQKHARIFHSYFLVFVK